MEKVEITDIASEGKAMARVNHLVVFVPLAAPGDIVDIQLIRKRSHYAEGKVMAFHQYSPVRSTPFCEHFGICGGCKWQHLPYEEQLRYKQKQVTDNLQRIGKIDVEESLPIIGSPQTLYYRNKLEYTFSNKRWLTESEISSEDEITQCCGAGFHIQNRFDKVLDIQKCWLQDDISNRIRLFIKNYCLTHDGYPFFDLRLQEGLMRTLIIRTTSTGELMAIVVFYYEDSERRENLLNQIKKEFPEITSLMYVINEKCNDTITDQNIKLYAGKGHLIEQMEDLKFKIGPKSFFQTNSKQAHQLYKTVREFAALSGDENVYDLYTGTGTIANFIAGRAKKVTGIEYVPEAIEDAAINARLNKLNNTQFFAGDIKDVLTKSFIDAHGQPDLIITDPPRAGMQDNVTDAILTASPVHIIYVSCNPATQARDLNRLSTHYAVKKIQPVDMFPHTHHVENVALLRLKNHVT